MAGDVAAQRAQLDQLIGRLNAGQRVGRRDAEWLEAVVDRTLFDPLAAAIRLAGARQRDEPPFDDVLAPLQAAVERVDPLAAVALYDHLIAAPPWFGAQFLVDRRDEVLQRLITEAGQRQAARVAVTLGLPITWVES